MGIKWNWGTKLFIWTALFMLMIIVYVILMYQQDYSLVEKDYYPKAVEYEKQIAKVRKSDSLERRVEVVVEGDFLKFRFQEFFSPDELSGKIVLYRPSGDRFDIEIPIRPDSSGTQFHPLKDLLRGKYIVKIDYTYRGDSFFQETPVLIKMF